MVRKLHIFEHFLIVLFCILGLFMSSLLFVNTRITFASEQPTMRVGYLDEFLPYSNFKHKTHTAGGLIHFLVGRFEKDAGVKVECIPYLDEGRIYKDLKSGKLDVVFPVYADPNLAKRLGVALSTPVDKGELLLIFKGEDRPELVQKMGVLDLSNIGRTYAELNLARNSYVYFPDIVFAAKGLDSNLVNSILIQSTQYDILKKSIPPEYKFNKKVYIKDIGVSFALAPKSSYLGIVNKVIAEIPKDDLRRAIIKATNDKSRLTIKDYIMDNLLLICLTLIGGLTILFLGFAWYYRMSKKTETVLLESKLKAEELLDKEQHLRQELEKAMFKAEHDSMTGLLNKGCFEELLRLHADQLDTACVIIDIDLFKNVNDKYGHEVGDKVIKAVAKAIRASFRDTDYVARIGGDEFAVILRSITKDKRGLLTKRLENIRKMLDKQAEGLPAVTLSIGVAFADEASQADAKEMFRHADIALYGVKKNGRDGFNFYN